MAKPADDDDGDGATMARNLILLFGYGKVDVAGLAKVINERVGGMTPQRLSAILKAAHLEPTSIGKVAKAIGVTPEELMQKRPSTGKAPQSGASKPRRPKPK